MCFLHVIVADVLFLVAILFCIGGYGFWIVYQSSVVVRYNVCSSSCRLLVMFASIYI